MSPRIARIPPERQDELYQLFILFVSLFALAILGAGTVLPAESPTRQVLAYADNAVCVLFFADFLQQLARAPDRWGYFIRWGWIDLLSSIPMVDAFRVGRAARILRVLRLLRAAKATRILTTFVLRRRAQGAFLAASLITLLLMVFASIAILQFERPADGNIRTAPDAVWWTVVTMTTVGYGDHFPVTMGGRVVAALLMMVGIGLFGTFSGFVASWFLRPGEQQQDDALADVRQELVEIRRLLEVRGGGAGLAPPRSHE